MLPSVTCNFNKFHQNFQNPDGKSATIEMGTIGFACFCNNTNLSNNGCPRGTRRQWGGYRNRDGEFEAIELRM